MGFTLGWRLWTEEKIEGRAAQDETATGQAQDCRKRSCQQEWKCKMFSGVASSGFIIGVLSYEHFDNVTWTQMSCCDTLAVISMYSRGAQTFSCHGSLSKKSLQVRDPHLTWSQGPSSVGSIGVGSATHSPSYRLCWGIYFSYFEAKINQLRESEIYTLILSNWYHSGVRLSSSCLIFAALQWEYEPALFVPHHFIQASLNHTGLKSWGLYVDERVKAFLIFLETHSRSKGVTRSNSSRGLE